MFLKFGFMFLIKSFLVKNVYGQVLSAGRFGYQQMPVTNVPVNTFASKNNIFSIINSKPLNYVTPGNGLPFNIAMPEKNNILLNNNLPFAGMQINPGGPINKGISIPNTIPFTSGLPIGIASNMPVNTRFQVIDNMQLPLKMLNPRSLSRDEGFVTNSLPLSALQTVSDLPIRNRQVPLNLNALIKNFMSINDRLPMPGISMGNGLPAINGFSANNILPSGVPINGFAINNSRQRGRILQVPVDPQFNNFENSPVTRRSITNIPAGLSMLSNIPLNVNSFGGSKLAQPGNINMNMPTNNVLKLGELGTLPMFNGLPVAGITETVTVLNPEACNYLS